MKIKSQIKSTTIARQKAIMVLKHCNVWSKCTDAEKQRLNAYTTEFDINACRRTLLDKYL